MGYPLLGTRETWVVSTAPWPLFSRLPLQAPRPNSGVRPCADPPPLDTLPPTAELPKTERGSISTSGPSMSVCHRNRRFVRTKSTDSSPLAAAQPLITPSWPEALNSSGSRRACRMASSRNARLLFV